jgi:hypothetical protein
MITVQFGRSAYLYFVPRRYVMFKCSNLPTPNLERASDQPMEANPYRASKWPIGTHPNRGREPPMRTSPFVRLSGIHVAERETRHGSRHDRRGGGHFTRHTIPDPPPLKAEWQGGSGILLSTVDHDELISTIRELRIQFQTPPLPLKAEQ